MKKLFSFSPCCAGLSTAENSPGLREGGGDRYSTLGRRTRAHAGRKKPFFLKKKTIPSTPVA